MIIDITSKKVLVPSYDLLIKDDDKRTGLLKYNRMPKDHGVIIDDCQRIHSKGMKFNFQAIYLDNMNKVIALNKSFKPGLTGKYRPRVTTVIEVPIGTIEKANVQLGDMILWVKWGKMTKKAEGNNVQQYKDQYKYFDQIRQLYKDMGYDLGHMKMTMSDIGMFNNNKPNYDMPREQFGGSWASGGNIYLNKDVDSVIKHYGVKEPKDIFTNRLIAHELGHEIYKKNLDENKKKELLDEIKSKKFWTGYLDQYVNHPNPDKLNDEMVAEFFGQEIVNKIKEQMTKKADIDDAIQSVRDGRSGFVPVWNRSIEYFNNKLSDKERKNIMRTIRKLNNWNDVDADDEDLFASRMVQEIVPETEQEIYKQNI